MENELAPATLTDLQGVDFAELERLEIIGDEAIRKERAIYLDHPNRKFFFEIDIAEVIWQEAYHLHRVILGDQELQEVLDIMFDEPILSMAAQDALREYADQKERGE